MSTGADSGVGLVDTRYVRVGEGGFRLDGGRCLEFVTVAYEQYGRVSAAGDNVILVCHALSGGAHAAGYHAGARKPGWWDTMIGPGKAFDTDRYCVISSSVLGSCYGTTGPASPDPVTGKPYGSRFPVVTVRDMVRVQRALLDRLGVTGLLAVAGGSMGGMLALEWAVTYPAFVRSVIALATTARHSPQQIAFNEIARRAVMADPNWRGGDYYGGTPPVDGLAVARMLGHVTYLSDRGMQRKFGRRRHGEGTDHGYRLEPDFEVERYLGHQARSFVDRFDANALIYMTRALDYFDLEADGRSLADVFGRTAAAFLLLTFSSDWLYPPSQLETVSAALRAAGRDVWYREIQSEYGHDAFLLEHERQTPFVATFLGELYAPDTRHRGSGPEFGTADGVRS